MLQDYFKFDEIIGRPAFIFISGAQGIGKSKISADLANYYQSKGKKVVTISLDDFYLTFDQQQELAAKGNPLLKYRGLPGTHDIDLAIATLSALDSGVPVLIPRYQKALRQGRGDRADFEQITGPVDIVILEGWCLGFRRLPDDYLFENYGDYKAEDIRKINQLFEIEKLYKFADAFVHYKPKDIAFVTEWRWEQEFALKLCQGQDVGLTREEVEDFVSRFMPIYHYYLPGLELGVSSDRFKLSIQFEVDFDRSVLSFKQF
jgi:D-glycerate 3-kinase